MQRLMYPVSSAVAKDVVFVKDPVGSRSLAVVWFIRMYLRCVASVSYTHLLPSACFIVDFRKEQGAGTFVFTGGGYGHGVGMSQNLSLIHI